METLQEILDNSKTINTREIETDFVNCMYSKFGISNVLDNENPYLILIIENNQIIHVGFSKKIATYVYREMGNKLDLSTIRVTKLELRLYIKDLTKEGIDYDNFRKYKNSYIKKFITEI